MASTAEIKGRIASVRQTQKITNAMYLIASTKLRKARSDLDEVTQKQLAYGQGLMRLLRQPQYHPMSQHQQVTLLVAALNHVMQDVPPEQIDGFRDRYLRHMEEAAGGLCRRIDQTGLLPREDYQAILAAAKAFAESDRPNWAGESAG